MIIQSKRIELTDSSMVNCLWISQDPEQLGEAAHDLVHLTLASSLNQSLSAQQSLNAQQSLLLQVYLFYISTVTVVTDIFYCFTVLLPVYEPCALLTDVVSLKVPMVLS